MESLNSESGDFLELEGESPEVFSMFSFLMVIPQKKPPGKKFRLRYSRTKHYEVKYK